MDFFKRDELEFFKSIAGTPYKKNHKESTQKKERLLPLVDKSNYWADLLRDQLPEFEVENNGRWQTGHNFRKYTWHKIYKADHEDELIFFTVGVDGLDPSLLIKLDCMRETHGSGDVLPDDKIHRFFRFTSGYNTRISISSEELQFWDWEKLVARSIRFISENYDLYNDTITHVHEYDGEAEASAVNEFVSPELPPEQINSNIRNRKRTFSGSTTDWNKEQKRAERLGLTGERFITMQEKQKLIREGFDGLADQVEKVEDGCGYDLRSYNTNGNEIFIEVKTTSGNKSTPFYITENEKQFMSQNQDNYYLYRVYDFNRATSNGSYFVKSGKEVLKDCVFTPLKYEVST